MLAKKGPPPRSPPLNPHQLTTAALPACPLSSQAMRCSMLANRGAWNTRNSQNPRGPGPSSGSDRVRTRLHAKHMASCAHARSECKGGNRGQAVRGGAKPWDAVGCFCFTDCGVRHRRAEVEVALSLGTQWIAFASQTAGSGTDGQRGRWRRALGLVRVLGFFLTLTLTLTLNPNLQWRLGQTRPQAQMDREGCGAEPQQAVAAGTKRSCAQ